MSPTATISTLFPYTTLFRSSMKADDTFGVAGPAKMTGLSAGLSVFLSGLVKWLRHKRSLPHHRIEIHLRDISQDRKSTRLNSSHTVISYAVFCLKKKNK